MVNNLNIKATTRMARQANIKKQISASVYMYMYMCMSFVFLLGCHGQTAFVQNAFAYRNLAAGGWI